VQVSSTCEEVGGDAREGLGNWIGAWSGNKAHCEGNRAGGQRVPNRLIARQRAVSWGHEHGDLEEGSKARAGGRSGDATPGFSRERR